MRCVLDLYIYIYIYIYIYLYLYLMIGEKNKKNNFLNNLWVDLRHEFT